jgi:hypothetical protein
MGTAYVLTTLSPAMLPARTVQLSVTPVTLERAREFVAEVGASIRYAGHRSLAETIGGILDEPRLVVHPRRVELHPGDRALVATFLHKVEPREFVSKRELDMLAATTTWHTVEVRNADPTPTRGAGT